MSAKQHGGRGDKGGAAKAGSDHRRNYLKQLSKRSHREGEEIKLLEAAITAGAPAVGSTPSALVSTAAPAAAVIASSAAVSYAAVRTFEELPLSQYTKDALKEAKYVNLTAIQRAVLPHALCGRDILGAAKTGSGKTLAFIIPVVERLYRLKWSSKDGLGSLVLTPTRELALQIFDELKKVGRRHDISAGLLVGGNSVKEEQNRVGSIGILVCTPGRLMQHMDETPGFDASQLQTLVLDEADRILDMGFAATMDAILEGLPKSRQTMLFSATQTKSVKDLARLSLRSPEYLAVHADATCPTPLKLQQTFMVVELQEKMNTMWSFIKTHLHCKTIIFLSTCKQVRFVYEAFRRLRPGIPLRALHGGMKQMKRTTVYSEFCNDKATVLLATDVAARGLDFPTVDWVLQVDCPEDVATYIHRVGRTARYMAAGRALLLLEPSESPAMLAQLAAANVPIKQVKANPGKTQPVTPALQALLSKSLELKEFAQRSLTAYLRSMFLQPNKAVFDVTRLPITEYAHSLGLSSAPKLRFLRKAVAGSASKATDTPAGDAPESRTGKATTAAQGSADSDAADGSDDEGNGSDGEGGGQGRKRARVEQAPDLEAAGSGKKSGGEGGSSGAGRALLGSDDGEDVAGAEGGGGGGGDEDEDGDFLVVKKRDVFRLQSGKKTAVAGDAEEESESELDEAHGGGHLFAAKPKKKKKQKIKVGGSGSGSRVVFDEEGQALDPLEALAATGLGIGEDGPTEDGGSGLNTVSTTAGDRFKAAAAIMAKRDAEDKARLKDLRKSMEREKKRKRKETAEDEAGQDGSDGGSDDGLGEPTLAKRGRAGKEDGGSSSGGSESGEEEGSDGEEEGSGDEHEGASGDLDSGSDDEEEMGRGVRGNGSSRGGGGGSGSGDGDDDGDFSSGDYDLAAEGGEGAESEEEEAAPVARSKQRETGSKSAAAEPGSKSGSKPAAAGTSHQKVTEAPQAMSKTKMLAAAKAAAKATSAGTGVRGKAGKGKQESGMTLAQQEALALKLLMGGGR
ncbi:MAG: hypothetical protein WDW38_000538 [Sanguina aurantia]